MSPVEKTIEKLEQQYESVRETIARYEEAGEPDGCWYCGSSQHETSDCHEEV